MKYAYLVQGSSGEWDCYSCWSVKIFEDMQQALDFANMCTQYSIKYRGQNNSAIPNQYNSELYSLDPNYSYNVSKAIYYDVIILPFVEKL